MPIYEYECQPCGAHFEKKQGFDDEPAAECPQCEGEARRVIRSVPIIFKGSGFYVTDHRKDGGGGSAESKKEPLAKKEPSDKKEPSARKEKTKEKDPA